MGRDERESKMRSRLWSFGGMLLLLAAVAHTRLLAAHPSGAGKVAVNLSVGGDDGLIQAFVASLGTHCDG